MFSEKQINKFNFITGLFLFICLFALFNYILKLFLSYVLVIFISTVISLLITKFSYKFCSEYLIDNLISKHKINFVDLIGFSGTAETIITRDFGLIVIDNKIYPCQSYLEKIDKGKRILVTGFNLEEQLYIVDYYPNI